MTRLDRTPPELRATWFCDTCGSGDYAGPVAVVGKERRCVHCSAGTQIIDLMAWYGDPIKPVTTEGW